MPWNAIATPTNATMNWASVSIPANLIPDRSWWRVRCQELTQYEEFPVLFRICDTLVPTRSEGKKVLVPHFGYVLFFLETSPDTANAFNRIEYRTLWRAPTTSGALQFNGFGYWS